jgi:hypothetical protein
MKREVVVFSVIGGLMWMATALSVLAVAVFEANPGVPRAQDSRVIDETALDRALAEARARDAEMLSRLCGSTSADSPRPGPDPDPGRRTTNAGNARTEDACREHSAISVIRFCLLLT